MKTAKQLLDLIENDCKKNGGLVLTHKGKQYLVEEAWVKDWDNKTKKEKNMKNKYITAIIIACTTVAFYALLIVYGIYQDQTEKLAQDQVVQGRLNNESRAIRDGDYTIIPSLDEQLNYAIGTQSARIQCSSYINTNCEGYHAPMCVRE